MEAGFELWSLGLQSLVFPTVVNLKGSSPIWWDHSHPLWNGLKCWAFGSTQWMNFHLLTACLPWDLSFCLLWDTDGCKALDAHRAHKETLCSKSSPSATCSNPVQRGWTSSESLKPAIFHAHLIWDSFPSALPWPPFLYLLPWVPWIKPASYNP